MLVVGRDLPDPARLFIWWLLCMIFASLRFDDALHVKPDELKMQDEGLFGVAWANQGRSEADWYEIHRPISRFQRFYLAPSRLATSSR